MYIQLIISPFPLSGCETWRCDAEKTFMGGDQTLIKPDEQGDDVSRVSFMLSSFLHVFTFKMFF